MAKKMYIEVIASDSSMDGFYEIYNPISKTNILSSKDNENLVSIDKAEAEGAEKMKDCFKKLYNLFYKSFTIDMVSEIFDGEIFISEILNRFSAKEIIERIEKIDKHEPEVGDVYIRKNNKENAVVVEVNEDNVRLMRKGSSGIYITQTSCLDDFYEFSHYSDSDIKSVIDNML